jgi:hypothetical protein
MKSQARFFLLVLFFIPFFISSTKKDPIVVAQIINGSVQFNSSIVKGQTSDGFKVIGSEIRSDESTYYLVRWGEFNGEIVTNFIPLTRQGENLLMEETSDDDDDDGSGCGGGGSGTAKPAITPVNCRSQNCGTKEDPQPCAGTPPNCVCSDENGSVCAIISGDEGPTTDPDEVFSF